METWLNPVKLNEDHVEQSLQTVMANAEKEYRDSLDPSKFFQAEDLKTAEAQARGVALHTLHNFPQKLDQSRMKEAENELITQMNAIYENALDQVAKNYQTQMKNLELAVQEGVRRYKASMENLLLSSST